MNDYLIVGNCALVLQPGHAAPAADLIDSLLYAQLAATRKFPGLHHDPDWWSTCLAAMRRFGWVGHERQTFDEPFAEVASLWDWMANHLPRSVPRAGIDSLGTRLNEARQTASGCTALQLWVSQGMSTVHAAHPDLTRVGVQLAVAGSDVFTLLRLEAQVRRPEGIELLSSPLARCDVVGNLRLSCHALVLQDDVYSRYRNAIASALQPRKEALVKRLEEARHV